MLGLALIVGAILGLSGVYQPSTLTDLVNRLGFVAEWLYFTLTTSSAYQATPGKLALGLKATDEEGRRIGLLRANVRYWSKLFSAFLLLIGFFDGSLHGPEAGAPRQDRRDAGDPGIPIGGSWTGGPQARSGGWRSGSTTSRKAYFTTAGRSKWRGPTRRRSLRGASRSRQFRVS